MKITLSLIWLSCLITAAAAQPDKGGLNGKISDTKTGELLAGAVVEIVGVKRGTLTGEQGYYTIEDLPAGVYTIKVSYIGYQTRQVKGVEIGAAGVARLNVELEEELIRLSAMTVTPGRFAIMGKEPEVRQTLTREDIQSIPQFGEDIYRAVARLSGISGSDFPARFTVRGGSTTRC